MSINSKFAAPISKMDNVSYEIRGPLLQAANKLTAEGYKVIHLNIGNPFTFGFKAPESIVKAVESNLASYAGYSDSKGILPARQAIFKYNNNIGIKNAKLDHIYIGNGVSELILMITTAILDKDEELLIPMPDYPLWTAATNLAGGKAVHYLCDENNGWQPDIEDIRKKISYKTKAILIINPNNPTGAVYSKEILQEIVNLAREYNLLILSDEIYDRVLYDDVKHVPIASLADDVLIATFNGLSKSYMSCGYRVGWLQLSGPVDEIAQGLIISLDKLASMRLCANVPMQLAIEPALHREDLIEEHVRNGRLLEQRNITYKMLNEIDGISCTEVKGTLYAFPKFDSDKFTFESDYDLVYKFLQEEKVLLVHGSGFNWHKTDHFRVVFLPEIEQLKDALNRFKLFLDRYRK